MQKKKYTDFINKSRNCVNHKSSCKNVARKMLSNISEIIFICIVSSISSRGWSVKPIFSPGLFLLKTICLIKKRIFDFFRNELNCLNFRKMLQPLNRATKNKFVVQSQCIYTIWNVTIWFWCVYMAYIHFRKTFNSLFSI